MEIKKFGVQAQAQPSRMNQTVVPENNNTPITPRPINENIINIFNERLGDEYTAYYFYRNAANWCKNMNYKKAAAFFESESEGELGHAKGLQDYLTQWNIIPQIPQAPTTQNFSSLVDIINKAYNLEYNLLEKYSENQKMLSNEHPATFNFIQKYVDIQNGEVSEYSDLLNAAVGANTNTTIPKFKVCDTADSVWRHPSDLTTRSLRLSGSIDSRRRDRPFFLTSNTRDVYEYAEYSVGGTTYNSGEWDYHARDSTVITRERLPQETEWVTHVSFTNNTIEDPLLFTTYTGAALYGNPMTDGNLTANRFAGGFRCCHTSKLDSDVQRVEYASNEDMLSAQKVFFKWEKINVYNNKPVSKIVIQKNLSPSFIFTDGSIFLPYDGLGFFPKSGLLAGKNVIDISCSNSGRKD